MIVSNKTNLLKFYKNTGRKMSKTEIDCKLLSNNQTQSLWFLEENRWASKEIYKLTKVLLCFKIILLLVFTQVLNKNLLTLIKTLS